MPVQVLTRAELEERLDQMRSDFQAAQEHQDSEWNRGFRAIREDHARQIHDGIAAIRTDLREFVTEKYLTARLSPVQNVAYGALTSLVAFLTAVAAYRFMH